ncbi:TPA: hypothetical protein SIA31_003682 [Aeromonas sobria]|jgi:acetyltransferase-like isoleucine patch superfamily enzyme|nr:hypothetical protein [Aeromonas sobria]
MNMQLGKFIYKLILKNGEQVENPTISGLDVEFKGTQGGVVEVEDGAVFHNTKIIIGGMGYVHIKKTHPRGIRNTKIEMGCACKFKKLFIDEGCSIESSRFSMINENDLTIKIGKHCMLSSNVLFRPSDGHTIFDITTGSILNKSKPIVLGDHIWVGASATFLKGAEIPNNSIVGTGSIISRKFTEEFTAIAGIPASVLKKGVGWDRAYIPVFERERASRTVD